MTRARTLPTLLALAALLASASCDLTGPGSRLVPGYLEGVVGEGPEILVPERVPVGEEVVIEITTWGLSGCWARGETRVSAEGLEASVRPFDREPADLGDRGCTGSVPAFSHQAALRFQEAGTARVAVTGRRFPDGATVSHIRELQVVDVTEGGP